MINRTTFLIASLVSSLWITQAHAQECMIENRTCILSELEKTAQTIEQTPWRDQTYRELSKTYAADGKIDQAIALLERIHSPDTIALTIRGIGMAAADNNLSSQAYNTIFTKLRIAAETITHPPSYAIALTYIAMGQAFAGDNDGAWKTASDMKNEALRHKAYGETAEIQAEKGDATAAMKSIGFIESEAYKNKAYGHIAKIFADHGKIQESYKATTNITNPYKHSLALQYILDTQKPREKQK